MHAAPAAPARGRHVELRIARDADGHRRAVVESSHDGVKDEWLVDCGAARDRTARDTAGVALAQQGWTSCGSQLASASWSKGPTMVVVSEPADAAIGFRIAQRPKIDPCR